jgi:predicted HAD superfamily Cof-like phosphohydrolase
MMGKSETVLDKLHIFHRAFRHPIGLKYPKPSALIDGEKDLRRRLIQEEFKELMYAVSNEEDDEVLKELCDLVYVCVGFAATYGWSFDTAFNRVHLSNMSKLDREGNPVYREDGKVVKSDRYEPPKLSDLV